MNINFDMVFNIVFNVVLIKNDSDASTTAWINVNEINFNVVWGAVILATVIATVVATVIRVVGTTVTSYRQQ